MEMSDTSQITLRIDNEILESIKADAIRISATSGEQTTYTDLIKQILTDKYFSINEDQNCSVARKIFMVDEVPSDKEINYYEKDINVIATIIAKDGKTIETSMKTEQFMVPEYFIAAHPVWEVDRPLTIDKARTRAIESLNRQEDLQMSRILDSSIKKDYSIEVDEEYLNEEIRNLSEKIYDGNQMTMVNILTSPYVKNNFLEKNCKLNIIESTMIPKKYLYLLPPAEFLGVIPERMKTKFFHCPEYKNAKDGIVAIRKIGMAVLYDAFGRIILKNLK